MVVFLSSSIPSGVNVCDGWVILELIALNEESNLSNLFLFTSVKNCLIFVVVPLASEPNSIIGKSPLFTSCTSLLNLIFFSSKILLSPPGPFSNLSYSFWPKASLTFSLRLTLDFSWVCSVCIPRLPVP